MDTQALFTYFFSRITIFVTILGGSLLAVYFGLKISEGNVLTPYFIIVAGVSLICGIALGGRIWLLLPLAYTLSDMPAIPLGGKSIELFDFTAAVVFAFFLTRVAFGREKMQILNLKNIAILSFCAWVLLVYMANPVGMFFLGSGTGGAKFYLKIIVCLMAYVVISSQKISDQEAKWIALITVIGGILSFALFMVHFQEGGNDGESLNEDAVYTWHGYLAGPAKVILIYLFSRYTFKQIFSLNRPWVLPAILSMYPLMLYSGKRALFLASIMYACVTSLLRKNYFALFVVVFAAVAGVGFLVTGHGTLFELPPSMQRVFMNLPGNWDKRVLVMRGEGLDDFREGMRKAAWKRIEEAPFFGKGYAMDMREVTAIVSEGNLNAAGSELLAMGGSWHSTVLGIPADFGLPALLLYFIFITQWGVVAWSLFKKSPENSWSRVYAATQLLCFVEMLMRCYTSGSSATWCYSWVNYGIILAMLARMKAEVEVPAVSKPESRSTRQVFTA